MVGALTTLIVAFKVFSKLCYICDNHAWLHGNGSPSSHCCGKNWSESSKAMEPHGIVKCAKDIWNSCKAWLKVFISNDDSTSHAALHHINPKSSGKLPAEIHEPELLLVDPSHCC